MSKVAEVAPDFTTTLPGNTSASFEEAYNCTTLLLAGAGPLNVTVPTAGSPPVTDAGDTDNADTVMAISGLTVNAAVFLEFPNVAVIVTFVGVITVFVPILNVAVVPDGIVAFSGSVIAVLGEADNVILAVANHVLLNVTVPVTMAPPVTDADDNVTAEIVGEDKLILLGAGVAAGLNAAAGSDSGSAATAGAYITIPISRLGPGGAAGSAGLVGSEG